MIKATKQVIMGIKNGLHLRPAQKLVDIANKFSANITVSKDSRSADAKSIFDVITLGAEHGSILHLHAEGEDSVEALDVLGKFITEFEDA